MSLGEFEYLLITAEAALGDNAYGAAMREAMVKATGRTCSIGALYTTLERLEAKGLVKTWMAEGTPQGGGRSRRMVRVTSAGKAAASSFYETIIRVSGRAPCAIRVSEVAG
ncbi:MAG TPA: helix-turn-helix transcriptional regulator [Terriglobales bacterium]